MSVWVEELLFIKTKGTRMMPRIHTGINRIRMHRIIFCSIQTDLKSLEVINQLRLPLLEGFDLT